MRKLSRYRYTKLVAAIGFVLLISVAHAQTLVVENSAGMRMLVEDENTQPSLRIILPGRPLTDQAIQVLFPEHVTARKADSAEEQLYLFRPGKQGEPPQWRKSGKSLEYRRDFGNAIRMLARATLEDDGVRFHYEFTNRSNANYDMIYAVTDPRLTSIFHDVRLERTYVHHPNGFDLLASETPARLTLPLDQWLPARYLAPFTWPVVEQRVEQRNDGITYYNKSRRVDQPLIATVSSDNEWIVASFTRQTGNVWSNPELTCQHVDPQTSLPPGQQATLEIKLLVTRAPLGQILQMVIRQRDTLQ
jgi:hypothetical protein